MCESERERERARDHTARDAGTERQNERKRDLKKTETVSKIPFKTKWVKNVEIVKKTCVECRT